LSDGVLDLAGASHARTVTLMAARPCHTKGTKQNRKKSPFSLFHLLSPFLIESLTVADVFKLSEWFHSPQSRQRPGLTFRFPRIPDAVPPIGIDRRQNHTRRDRPDILFIVKKFPRTLTITPTL
jgi:hypothetical protein